MLNSTPDGKDDCKKALKQLNKIIGHLSVAEHDCNNAIESGNKDREQKTITKICELYDEFNQHALDYLQLLLEQNEFKSGMDEVENLMQLNTNAESFFSDKLEVDDVISQNYLNLEIYNAVFLFSLQKYRRALKSCELILEVDDSKDAIWVIKGAAYAELGDNDNALQAFETAIELDWNNDDAWVRKAQILQASGNYENALESFETALEINETNSEAIEGKDAVLNELNEEHKETPVQGKSRSAKKRSKSSINDSSMDEESVNTSDKEYSHKWESKEKREKKVFKKPVEKKTDKDKPRGFACVAGMLELKEILTRDVIKPLQNPENYKKFNVTIPNGILLYGPPGCGKTFIVEKLAEEVGYNFIKVPPSKIGSKYIHETSDNIAKIFTEAKDNAPTILFFDEFEALVPRRETLGAEGQFKNEEINEFLTHLNNASNHGILVVGATNQVNLIDSAVMRAGRMDKVILVPPPDPDARKELFRSKLSKVPHSDDIDYEKLAEITDCYSSSDITAIIEAAGRIAGDQELEEINQDLMLHVIENQKPSISKSQIKSYEEFRHFERK